MRKMLYSLFLLLLPVLVMAQEPIEWLTIEEAVERNQEEPRKFIIDVYTDWCGWCKRMDAGTFSDKKVAAYINENFHPVKLNGEHKEDIILGENTFKFVNEGRRGYNELAAVLLDGRLGYPSIVYLNKDLQRLTVSPGFKQPADLMTELAYIATEAYKDTDFETFSEQYNKTPNPLSLK
jgi:thioredoxin-related protein